LHPFTLHLEASTVLIIQWLASKPVHVRTFVMAALESLKINSAFIGVPHVCLVPPIIRENHISADNPVDKSPKMVTARGL
jgi:hypothetical protein